MNAQILDLLKANRQVVLNRYQEMVDRKNLNNEYGCNHVVIESKEFFGKVVMSYFEDMSKIMVNKCLKSNFVFITQLSKACDKACYACAKPQREANRAVFARY